MVRFAEISLTADDDPGTGPPGASEEKDVDADEGNHGSDGVGVLAIDGTDDGDNELTDDHAQSTPEEQGAATELLDGVEGDGGGQDVDDGSDHAQQEGVLDCAQLSEEGGTEVEDEVDTSPLLHHLKRGTEDGTTEVAVGVEDVATEAVEPGLEVATRRHQALLVLVVGLDLVELVLDKLGVLGLVTDAGEHLAGAVLAALADEETGRLGKQEQTGTENQSPQHLDADRDAVGAGVGTFLGGVVNARGQHQTDGNAELVAGDNGTTDLAGCNLRHVQDNDGRDEADTESSNETAGDEQTNAGGSSLQDDTNDENNTSENDGGPTTEPISQVTSNESSEEGTSRKDGHNQRLLRRGDHELGGGSGSGVLIVPGLAADL